jgi:hypothetical protein
MKRNELIEVYNDFLREWNLPANAVIVGAGGALTILGLREETNDLDVDVPVSIYNRFRILGFPERHYTDPVAVDLIEVTDRVDLHIYHGIETMEIDGVWIYTPREILKQKKRLNREKDQEDIIRLMEYLIDE